MALLGPDIIQPDHAEMTVPRPVVERRSGVHACMLSPSLGIISTVVSRSSTRYVVCPDLQGASDVPLPVQP